MSDQCTCCFTDYLVRCNDYIQVYAKLLPDTMYLWVLTDKFGKQYSATFNTDAEGFWQIPVNHLPDGMINNHAGRFMLQVFEDAYACSPVKFAIAKDYDCIDFHIKDGTRLKMNLGCEF
jgi:hypothetical protein